ncbi:F-box only protein 50-like [Xyrichtys novacula]|uniref:F-box only protein 50-like n=1 Tax=Xyrichtys novacula TaxID=13765 RepID=A0AAV1FTU3_XYRNO|nr:F-box only protein 50-like [Xyrichtys novacula]
MKCLHYSQLWSKISGEMLVHLLFCVGVISLFLSAKPISDWKEKCEREWGLRGAPMPDNLDWESVYGAQPFQRNLLKNYSPHGLSKDRSPPNPKHEKVQMGRPFEPQVTAGDFSGWNTSNEVLPDDMSEVPEDVVICAWPTFYWFTMEQIVDLKVEGFWDELLDEFQPEIVVKDWYEESRLDSHIYELHVKLLGAHNSTVISEYSLQPTENLKSQSYTWKEVSYVFSGYGPGVRYVHFKHRLKNMHMNGMVNGFYQTLFTESSLMVNPQKTSS